MPKQAPDAPAPLDTVSLSTGASLRPVIGPGAPRLRKPCGRGRHHWDALYIKRTVAHYATGELMSLWVGWCRVCPAQRLTPSC